MTEIDAGSEISERPPVGNLTDFVYGVDEKNHLDIEVAVDHVGKIIIFHNRVFRKDIAWFEFDLETNRLSFIMDDGDLRDAGLPLPERVAKHMHNTHQIVMILQDEKTGDTKDGVHIPLIIHGQ